MNAKKDAEPGTRVINKGTTKYFSCKDCREDPKALCNCLLDALAYTKKLQGPVRVQLPDGRFSVDDEAPITLYLSAAAPVTEPPSP